MTDSENGISHVSQPQDGLVDYSEFLWSPIEIARFQRIPWHDPSYFEKCLGRQIGDTAGIERGKKFQVTFRSFIEPEYLSRVLDATEYLRDSLDETVAADQKAFYDILETYTRKSAYENLKNDYIPGRFFRSDIRTPHVPGFIYTELLEIASRLRPQGEINQSNTTYTPKPTDFVPIFFQFEEDVPERIEAIRPLVAETLRSGNLRDAILVLYTMERTSLWGRGNHSHCMNFFNVLLEKIGYKPISHGVIDFAAFVMDDSNDFLRYIMFVMQEVEGQDVSRASEKAS